MGSLLQTRSHVVMPAATTDEDVRSTTVAPTIVPLQKLTESQRREIRLRRSQAVQQCILSGWSAWSACAEDGDENGGLRSWSRQRSREVVNRPSGGMGPECEPVTERVQCRYDSS